jgi:hypothetical protein
MFATATGLPHPKHREWNHDASHPSAIIANCC